MNRSEALSHLDVLLSQSGVDAERQALALVADLRARGLLRGYGAARQVPKRLYTLEELRLNRIDTTQLLSPKDVSLDGLRNQLQALAVAGLCVLAYSSHGDLTRVLWAAFAGVTLLSVDQVANAGGGASLLVDSLGRLVVARYAARVSHHEAAHLLTAYLVGLLPRDYTLSALDAFVRHRALNVQAGCAFCETDFAAELSSGKLKATSMERYMCVALAGVVAEYLAYGRAEGGLGDVHMLDRLMGGLGFTAKKAESEVRWAVLNTAELLRRHARTHKALADAMQRRASIGECIAVIEDRLARCDDI